jgi:hypothetical protein
MTTEPTRRRRPHLLIFASSAAAVLVIGTLAFLYFTPSLEYNALQKAITQNGLGRGSGIPVNTLYTVPNLASPDTTKSAVLLDGTNHDTLYTIGWLDLSGDPQQLRTPDMQGRYYSIELVDPSDGTVFAYMGRRTTGTGPSDFVISGPDWHGTVPADAKQVSSPDNRVLLIGRVLVTGDTDLPAARALSEQLRLAPFGH